MTAWQNPRLGSEKCSVLSVPSHSPVSGCTMLPKRLVRLNSHWGLSRLFFSPRYGFLLVLFVLVFRAYVLPRTRVRVVRVVGDTGGEPHFSIVLVTREVIVSLEGFRASSHSLLFHCPLSKDFVRKRKGKLGICLKKTTVELGL